MIIWINGAFGSGKTQTAYELHRRLPKSYVYDPENAGFFIRENLPSLIRTDDFQDYQMWRKFNFDMLDYISARYGGDIIVPMTITDRKYYNEIVGSLSEKYDVKHIILCAKRETIIKRLASRFEGENSWAAGQIDRCIKAFDGDITGFKIYTDEMSISQVVDKVAELSGVALSVDNRSRLHRCFDRIITKFRHIR